MSHVGFSCSSDTPLAPPSRGAYAVDAVIVIFCYLLRHCLFVRWHNTLPQETGLRQTLATCCRVPPAVHQSRSGQVDIYFKPWSRCVTFRNVTRNVAFAGGDRPFLEKVSHTSDVNSISYSQVALHDTPVVRFYC